MIEADADYVALRKRLAYCAVSDERNYALYRAVRYIVARNIPGALVECGVFQGGSVIAMCLTLEQLGVLDRDVYLYDTFSGMTPPTALDVDFNGTPAAGRLHEIACACDLETVKSNIFGTTRYPRERLHFVQGRVEDTIPASAPERIALLRLDTDWYESTRHELVHMFPRLMPGGVLLIDDYGHWRGCRQAVDEFFGTAAAPLFQRIDYTGVMAVK